MSSYEASERTEIEAVLDGLTEATPTEVYNATLQYSARALAAVAAARADAESGGTFNGGTITEPLTIDTTDPEATPLAVEAPADWGFNEDLFVIQVGTSKMLSVGTDAGLDTADNPIRLGGGALYGTFIGLDPNSGTGQKTLQIRAAPGQTNKMVIVSDENGNAVLEVRADGSVHIKTGTSIVADL